MQNCPSTANTCPARTLPVALRDALSEARLMDVLPIPDELYRAALLALKDVLEHGCRDCVRNAVTYLVLDMKWPAHRAFG